MSGLYNPLSNMKLRNDAGLRSAVSATFGKVRGTRNHQGWDLYAPTGTPIYAVGDGVVVWTADHGRHGYGTQLLLQFNKDGSTGTSDPTSTRFGFYAHLSNISVEEGQFVKAGQEMGNTGVSGNADERYPHLHFEIRTSAAPLPKGLAGRIDPGEILGYQLLSCQAERQDEGIETVDMVCKAYDGPTEIPPVP